MQIDAHTRLFMLLGNPVDHSLSPAMHNAAFNYLNINSVYLACSVDDGNIGFAVNSLRALNAGGVNVTSPYKEKVIPYLDALSPEAKKLNAVNTIVYRDGQLYGESTDGEGFYRSLLEIKPTTKTGMSYLFVGIGGAARAAAFSLARHGASEILIANRSIEKAEAFIELLENENPSLKSSCLPLKKDDLAEVIDRADVIIYGLSFDAPDFLGALAAVPTTGGKIKVLVDMRYHPDCTAIMNAVRAGGGEAHNGFGMLLWQAVFAFELFTARQAPAAVMRLAAEAELQARGLIN